jgi:elongation factor 1-beta
VEQYGCAVNGTAATKDDEDDDFDLFGSDDEEDEAAREELKQKRAEESAPKKKKPLIAKSNIILNVKPWDDETDMGEVEKLFVPSQADIAVFKCLSGPPPAKFNHALRWYNHISSYSAQEQKAFPGVQKPVEQYGCAVNGTAATKDDEDDDFDLFGSDDEEDEAAREELKQKRAEESAPKKKKPLIAKSNIILNVKPWDDETDMGEVEKLVRTIEADGLLWGASKLVPLAYGIRTLHISCVVEDDKVNKTPNAKYKTQKW